MCDHSVFVSHVFIILFEKVRRKDSLPRKEYNVIIFGLFKEIFPRVKLVIVERSEEDTQKVKVKN